MGEHFITWLLKNLRGIGLICNRRLISSHKRNVTKPTAAIMKNRFTPCASVGGNYVLLVWCAKCTSHCFAEIKYEEHRNSSLNTGKSFLEITPHNKELCVFPLKSETMLDTYWSKEDMGKKSSCNLFEIILSTENLNKVRSSKQESM